MSFHFQAELVDPTAYIAPTATVLGKVTLAAQASVWFAAVIRGDAEAISLGRQSNVQDGCILHADPGLPCLLGERVTLGHGAIVHGAQVADDTMIGIRAVVLNGATVGSGSIIGAGAIVTERTQIPPNSLVLGVPGKVVRETTEADRERIAHAARHYVELAAAYREASQ
jgi:carbonic anhydrase/acetyltransferase-like protein (isoleucine patch superfamily)